MLTNSLSRVSKIPPAHGDGGQRKSQNLRCDNTFVDSVLLRIENKPEGVSEFVLTKKHLFY